MEFDLGRIIAILMGREGGGKTYIGKRLAADIGKPYASTGDIFRDRYRDDRGPLGLECGAMLNSGTYLSPESTLLLIGDRIRQPEYKDGFVLDGALRKEEEVISFPKMLVSVGRDFPVVVLNLIITREKSHWRIDDPKNPKARRRDERDTPKLVDSRLDEFEFRLPQRIAAIKANRWGYHEIDAMIDDKEAVYNQVITALLTHRQHGK